jgi:ribonucleoside-diphosphate reductase alpha chain
MLGLRYDTEPARAVAAHIAEVLRDTAYDASADLAVERGAFPLFNADLYLRRGTFASRLPARLKDRIRAQGLRNSHLLSVAPTGTSASPSPTTRARHRARRSPGRYLRKKRMADGIFKEVPVEDHAWRLYRHCGCRRAR